MLAGLFDATNRYSNWNGISYLYALAGSLAINAVICLSSAVLILVQEVGPADAPLLHRYIGRAKVSRAIADLSKVEGGLPLTPHAMQACAFTLHRPPARPATNQYQQLYPSSADLTGPILLIADNYLDCDAVSKQLDVANTAYENTGISACLFDTDCEWSLHTGSKDR